MIKKILKKTGGVFGINEVRDDLGELKWKMELQNQEIAKLRSELEQTQKNTSEMLCEEIAYIQNLIKTVVDIRKVPEKYGLTSLIQKGNLRLLLAVEKLIKDNGLNYFLDYGTLLGAVRHGGFIPWDDDVDIAMSREDFDKLLSILSKKASKNGVHIAHGEILRVYYKNTPLQVDIFPIDFYKEKLSVEGRDSLAKRVNALHNKEFQYDWSKLLTMEPVSGNKTYEEATRLRHEVLGADLPFEKARQKQATIVRGLEHGLQNPKARVMDFDMVYPLHEIEFCGYKMLAPNRPAMCLRLYYGDFSDFPRDIYPKHDDINARVTEETIETIERVISGVEKITIA